MNFLKKTKGIFATAIIVVMMFAFMIPLASINVYAETSTIDVVLVIDDTGSMKDNDPEFLAGLAVRKFADFVNSESSEIDVRFGIATYSHEIMDGALALGQTAEKIREFSTENITQSGLYTDAAVGVKWAVDQLKSGETEKKAIILIGDGANDLEGAPRTYDESASDLETALQDAKSNDIEIYTLAINPQSEEFKKYFSDIADQTGGKAYLPKTAADIDEFMKEIAAKIRPSDDDLGHFETELPADESVSLPITVPEGVFEMNIQFEHEKSIDIEFLAPDGQIYSEENGNISFYQEASYSNIKVQEPMAGEWTVTMLSKYWQNVKIDFIMHSDVVPDPIPDPINNSGLLWIILIIVFVLLIIIAGIIILLINLRNKEGGDYVRGNVSMKLVGRNMNDEMIIFDKNKFNCETVFEKKNMLSDLLSAYTKWYRAVNTGELAEANLSQYFNSALTEVTDKITICGNKKKQIIMRIPTGYEIQVDGLEVLKPTKLVISSAERQVDFRFKNQGYTYTINLVFTKNSY